ncbi:MAG: hypothetical protein NTU76_02860, partial [Candidatus Taylorbacteria bacterium]|nr:hypothetical protein [Candidatus Taylorbacteria bacterium]
MIFERHKKKIWPILSILFVILIIGFISNFNIGNIIKVNNFAYVYSAGDGSSGNPYQITSWTDLNGMRDNLTANYKLVEDLSSTTAGYGDYGDGWIPIGTSSVGSQFTGSFNGDGNTISDLIVNLTSTDYVGLFGYATGNISNLGLINVNVTGNARVGGLVGNSSGTITNSYSTGSVAGSKVNNSSKRSVGGLVGTFSGTISNSYSRANVTGSFSVGGLIGISAGTITNSYSTGQVTGRVYLGGLVGSQNAGTITNSFWDKTNSGKTVMCGTSDGTGCTDANGKTTAEMKLLNTFNSSGGNWDILGGQTDLNEGYPYLSGNSPVWYIASVSPFAGGSGTELDPYQIGTWIHLNNVRNYLSSYFIMIDNLSSTTSNYDTLGNNWTPIGDNGYRFTGSFNGNGKTISDLIINKPGVDYVGLFGFLSDDYSTGSISNLGLINVNITGNEYVGGLAGYSFTGGTITKSYSTGIVTGSSSVGGLIGEMYAGTITKSYSSGSVTGTVNYVGGIVGFQRNGTIEN